MQRRVVSLLLLLALVVTACTNGDPDIDADDLLRDRPQGSILPPAEGLDPGEGVTEPPVEESADDGRLVVQSAQAQLTTMLPDGSEVMALTDPGTVNSQATWAPDGSRIAWVAAKVSTGEVAIAADRFDRSDFRELVVQQQPFYLYWDPSARRIAHLAPSPAGFDLGIADLLDEQGPSNRRIDRGAPYFMAWGPDGDELLVHASGFRLDRIDLEAATVIIDEFPGSFGAPAWTQDGSLVFTDIEDDAQFLVTSGSSGEGRRPLVSYTGTLRFSVSNSGNRIVMQAVPADAQDPVVTASTPVAPFEVDVELTSAQPSPTPTPGFDDSLDVVDQIETGIPYVIGTFGGDAFALSSNPAIALFPSPDGQATAWLEASNAEADAATLHIDFGGQLHVLPPFVLSTELRSAYLPFFDQYSQSHDFWSPSSTLFVYAGRPANTDEPDGIWIYDRTTTELTRIADGVVASFTRTPQAGGAVSAL